MPGRTFEEHRAWMGARNQALTEWRRVDVRPLEKAWADKAKRSGSVVAAVLGKLKLDRRQAETEIVKVWNRLLDPNIAAHAQPAGIKNGTLFVSVDSSAWLSEIVRYRQREILIRLQSSFGSQTIRKLSFRIG
jgi:predicted nucleic acid-binding Zn ribbon protein